MSEPLSETTSEPSETTSAEPDNEYLFYNEITTDDEEISDDHEMQFMGQPFPIIPSPIRFGSVSGIVLPASIGRPKDAASPICSICIDMVEDDNNDQQVLGCGHVFHRMCLEPWLTNPFGSRSCPNCRAPVRSSVHRFPELFRRIYRPSASVDLGMIQAHHHNDDTHAASRSIRRISLVPATPRNREYRDG